MTMAWISHPECLLHEMGDSHPEQPARLTAIDQAIQASGLRSEFIEYVAPLVTREQLLRVHSQNYIDTIFKIAPTAGYVQLDPDTLMNPHSLAAAQYAAGSVIKAVDLVLNGQVNSAFCAIRPPGHHAEHNKAMGFCFFNNVAVGVAHALSHHQLQRVAIIDFDVHHGNGTEDIFKNDERVLLCSSFESPFYPFSGADTISTHILNMPLPAGTDGKLFREEIYNLWLDQIILFDPELIFFSAGFDGYYQDDMAQFNLHEEDYAWLTAEIKKIADLACGGRMISSLEGGYHLPGLGRCVVAHIKAMLS